MAFWRWAFRILWLSGILFASAFYVGVFRFNHPSAKKFPVMGVDVSHHEGHNDWRRAKADGVQFAYIKATEGGDYRDPQFIENWVKCKYADVPRGAYHFFTFCRPPLEQAANFIETVPPDPHTLPPALDLEFSGNCGRVPTQSQMEADITTYVHAISKRYPGRPVFYVTPDFYKRYYEGKRPKFPPHRLWIRNVLREPPQKACDEWTFWQFASRGRVKGVNFPTDLNVYCGDAERFAQFLEGVDEPALRKSRTKSR